MKLLDRFLIINPVLIGLLLFFKSSISHIKRNISLMVVTAPELVFMVPAYIGSKGNASKLMKEQFAEFLISVKEVSQ